MLMWKFIVASAIIVQVTSGDMSVFNTTFGNTRITCEADSHCLWQAFSFQVETFGDSGVPDVKPYNRLSRLDLKGVHFITDSGFLEVSRCLNGQCNITCDPACSCTYTEQGVFSAPLGNCTVLETVDLEIADESERTLFKTNDALTVLCNDTMSICTSADGGDPFLGSGSLKTDNYWEGEFRKCQGECFVDCDPICTCSTGPTSAEVCETAESLPTTPAPTPSGAAAFSVFFAAAVIAAGSFVLM